MIPKGDMRFSEKIMLHQKSRNGRTHARQGDPGIVV
jgi:hypothetical protein